MSSCAALAPGMKQRWTPVKLTSAAVPLLAIFAATVDPTENVKLPDVGVIVHWPGPVPTFSGGYDVTAALVTENCKSPLAGGDSAVVAEFAIAAGEDT